MTDIKKLGDVIEHGKIDPKLLKVAETNNRKTPISDTEKQEMQDSVATIGVAEPVIINLDNGIVTGQLRWAAALAVGLKEIDYIRIKFKDKFSERICSMLQDNLHHSLDDVDKDLFVKKCLEEDHKTYAEIAIMLGKSEATIRLWTSSQRIPEVLKNNEKQSELFAELPVKKKVVVYGILEKPQFKKDPIKSVQLLEYAAVAPLKELELARKDAVKGNPINLKYRNERLEENLIAVELKIPKTLDVAFRNKLKEINRDYVEVIVELITEFVRK